MLDHAESRQFIRMDVFCEITYKYPDSDQLYIGECLNISGAGILFRAEKLLEIGTALEVTIAPKNALTPPMKAYVEVTRSKEVEPGVFEVGTEIKGLKEN